MKKLYYAFYDGNGKPELYRNDGTESYMITVSSSAATTDDALETVS